jgi:hypothetical protein
VECALTAVGLAIASGCTNPPPTDDGASAGSTLPNTISNFGGSSAEYGALYPQTYCVAGGYGATQTVINDYNSGPFANPC